MIYATVDKQCGFQEGSQPYQVFELKNKIEPSEFGIKALVYSCKTEEERDNFVKGKFT